MIHSVVWMKHECPNGCFSKSFRAAECKECDIFIKDKIKKRIYGLIGRRNLKKKISWSHSSRLSEIANFSQREQHVLGDQQVLLLG